MKTILSKDDGMRHIRGSSYCTFETLCGACDTTDHYTKSNQAVNCLGCIDVATIVFNTLSRSELIKAIRNQEKQDD